MKTHHPSERPAGAGEKSRRRPEVKPVVPGLADPSITADMVARSAETSEPPLSAPTVVLSPVRIGYFKPEAREVCVAGTFNQWDPKISPLVRDAFGGWSIHLMLPPGEYRYRLVVDGEWRDDPNARRTVPNPFGGFDSVIDV